MSWHVSNPFSTRYVRPGAIPFVLPPGQTLDGLVQRLQENQWRGAIVGPHGSGKSTLLESLIPRIEAAGKSVRRVALRDGQRRLPDDFELPAAAEQQSGLVIVDGYEQLGWWARRKLDRMCQQRGWGLLVTVHAPPDGRSLPELYRTEPSLELLTQLVEHLIRGSDHPQADRITPADIAQAYAAHPENLREAMFMLYDVAERR